MDEPGNLYDSPSYWVARDETVNLLATFVLPIYMDVRGTPILVGSGFLLQHAGRCFLITAGHVWADNWKAGDLYYYVSANSIRKLDGQVLVATSSAPTNLLDVAVVVLSSHPATPDASTGKLAVTAERFAPRVHPRGDFTYAVLGFPETRNRFRLPERAVLANLYAWIGEGASAQEYARLNVNSNENLLVKFDVKRGLIDEQTPTVFPKPVGMSGGPIWHFHSNRAAEPLERLTIAGVATRHWRGDRLMVGTDIGIAMRMIDEFLMPGGRR